MRWIWLIVVVLVSGGCSRTSYIKSPEPFKPPTAETPVDARLAQFEKSRVLVNGPNHAIVDNASYNAREILRYYDDSRNLDASQSQDLALKRVKLAEEWFFFSGAYASIAGAIIGGISAYLATPNYDFNALNVIPGGALQGLGYGSAAGLVVGWTAYSMNRSAAEQHQRDAAKEFNRTSRNLLKLTAESFGDGAKAGVIIDY